MRCAKTIMSVTNISGLLRLYNLDAFHIFFKEEQNSPSSIATLKASSGHVGIQHRWFSFSPSSGEYVLLHPDFPLSLLILLSFLQSSRWSPGGAGHLLIDLSYILTCVAGL